MQLPHLASRIYYFCSQECAITVMIKDSHRQINYMTTLYFIELQNGSIWKKLM